MALLVGVALALAVALFIGRWARFDRDRCFYPTVLIVVASVYELFAVMGGSVQALGLESAAAALFVAASVIGFRTSLWLVAVALAGHGVFDFFHARLIANPGVPVWWPTFCGSYDVAAGAYMAWLLLRPDGGAAKAAA